jgi:hypothetical protein
MGTGRGDVQESLRTGDGKECHGHRLLPNKGRLKNDIMLSKYGSENPPSITFLSWVQNPLSI